MSAGVLRLLLVWVLLMALLASTLGAAYLPLGPAKPLAAYLIAGLKTGLILWFFMDLRREPALPRLAVAAGFVWIAILLTLSGADYLTR